MKRILLYAAAALISLALLGCVSHYRASSVKSSDYSYRFYSTPTPKLLFEAPTRPYVVVGTIEIRASRSATGDQLAFALRSEAFELRADAVIPPSSDIPRSLKYQSINPIRVYYIFDDGATAVLQGQAIRYKKE